LDVAVSVASGAACLRQFPVRRSGPVLLFPAEDSLAVVRQRLEGIAAAAQVPFDSLPVQVITAPSLRLDTPTDRSRLSHTVQQLRPILLILDPLNFSDEHWGFWRVERLAIEGGANLGGQRTVQPGRRLAAAVSHKHSSFSNPVHRTGVSLLTTKCKITRRKYAVTWLSLASYFFAAAFALRR
jgi:hypothetical protein